MEARAGGATTGCIAAGAGLSVSYPTVIFSFGGGGGGHATDGAEGGAITDYSGPQGFSKGRVSGSPTLEPLRGGCSGGFPMSSQGTYHNAGGAAQFSSGDRIVVRGQLDARGGDGLIEGDQVDFYVGGGGAGGSLLLEAPAVELLGSTQLLVSGGGGAQACATPLPSCGLGGAGATRTTAASKGMDITGNNLGSLHASGSGGGGLGFLRINTIDSTYTKNTSVVEDGSLSTGLIRTR